MVGTTKPVPTLHFLPFPGYFQHRGKAWKQNEIPIEQQPCYGVSPDRHFREQGFPCQLVRPSVGAGSMVGKPRYNNFRRPCQNQDPRQRPFYLPTTALISSWIFFIVSPQRLTARRPTAQSGRVIMRNTITEKAADAVLSHPKSISPVTHSNW